MCDCRNTEFSAETVISCSSSYPKLVCHLIILIKTHASCVACARESDAIYIHISQHRSTSQPAVSLTLRLMIFFTLKTSFCNNLMVLFNLYDMANSLKCHCTTSPEETTTKARFCCLRWVGRWWLMNIFVGGGVWGAWNSLRIKSFLSWSSQSIL